MPKQQRLKPMSPEKMPTAPKKEAQREAEKVIALNLARDARDAAEQGL